MRQDVLIRCAIGACLGMVVAGVGIARGAWFTQLGIGVAVVSVAFLVPFGIIMWFFFGRNQGNRNDR